MIALLIWVLVVVLIAGVIWYVIRELALPHPFGLIAQLIVLVIFVLILVSLLLGVVPVRDPLFR